MISAHNVKKYFGNNKVLDIASFEAREGEIIGFLGLNGAGKTTFMRILTSFLPTTCGDVRVCGYDVAKQSLLVRRHVGYLSEAPPLYPDMVVKDFLRFAARLKDIPARQTPAQVAKALDLCNLNGVASRVIGQLSKGYRQRVAIAQAIINDPKLLILDEPTNGLDPLQILDVRKLIKNLEHKRTVIISTHVLSEIEEFAQRVIIIKQGRIIKDHSLAETPEAAGGAKLFLKLRGKRPDIESALRVMPDAAVTAMTGDDEARAVELDLGKGRESYNELIEALLRTQVQILEIRKPSPKLEDVFIRLTKGPTKEGQSV